MLNVAVKAARAAGAIINRAALDVEAVRVSQKQVNDFVTEVDHASEQAIIETLLARLPRPRHLGRGIGQPSTAPRIPTTSGSSIRWTAPPTSSTASGLLRQHRAGGQGQGRAGRDLRPEPQRPVHRHPRPRRLHERAAHPRVQAHQAQRVPDLHRLSVPHRRQLQALPAHDGRPHAAHRRPAPPRRGGAGPGLRGGRLHRRLLRDRPRPGTWRPARCWSPRPAA